MLQVPEMPGHFASPTPVGMGTTVPTKEWLVTVLFPKLCKWMKEEGESGEGSRLNQSGERRRELEDMVPVGRYCQLYKELKEKHGPHLVKVRHGKSVLSSSRRVFVRQRKRRGKYSYWYHLKHGQIILYGGKFGKQ